MINGWVVNAYDKVNKVNGDMFGFRVDNFYDGSLSSIGMRISDYRFGWFEDYYRSGNNDLYWSGFYLNDEKI